MENEFEICSRWETCVVPNLKNYKTEDLCFRPIKFIDEDEIVGIVLNVSEKEILLLFNPNYYLDDILECFI